jgi:hypothetical protein
MKGVKLGIGHWALGIGHWELALVILSPSSPHSPIIDTRLGDGYYQPTR